MTIESAFSRLSITDEIEILSHSDRTKKRRAEYKSLFALADDSNARILPASDSKVKKVYLNTESALQELGIDKKDATSGIKSRLGFYLSCRDFFDTAKKHSMSSLETIQMCDYLEKEIDDWIERGEPQYDKKNSPRNVEYIPEGRKVIVHLKRRSKNSIKNNYFAMGGQKTITLSIEYPSGTIVINAAPKKDDKGNAKKSAVLACQREGQILQKFARIPNIIQVLRSSEKGLLLEYMNHHSLDTFMNNESFDEEEKNEAFKQICHGVFEIHQKKIIHNDIKLQNILVGSNDLEVTFDYKISDFGLAHDINDKPTYVEGTVSYFSPEKFLAYAVHKEITQDFAHDLWALGLTLFMLEYKNSLSVLTRGLYKKLSTLDAAAQEMKVYSKILEKENFKEYITSPFEKNAESKNSGTDALPARVNIFHRKKADFETAYTNFIASLEDIKKSDTKVHARKNLIWSLLELNASDRIDAKTAYEKSLLI